MTPYRWVVLGTHGLTILSSSFVGMTFSTVSGLISDIYNVPIAYINSCVSVFLVTQILMNFPSVSIIEKYGLSLSVSIRFTYSHIFFNHLFHIYKAKSISFSYNAWFRASIRVLAPFQELLLDVDTTGDGGTGRPRFGQCR